MNGVYMNDGCICWVVALLNEAKPLIEKLSLKNLSINSLHPIYANDAGTDWLVLTGVGQLNAASGSASLYQACPKSNSANWVNIGISGGGKNNIGDLFYVRSVRHKSINTNKSFYPFILPNIKIKTADLITTDLPETNYNQDALFDMEAWAFYNILQKKVTRELISVFKVVSDNSVASLNSLNKNSIFSLIEGKFDVLDDFRNKAYALSKQELRRKKNPEGFDLLKKKFHFTFTQTQELKYLLKRWHILKPGKCLESEMINHNNAKAVLNGMNTILEEIEVDWG